MPSPSRPHYARIATGLFVFAGAALIFANLLILADVPYMPLRYALVLLGRISMMAALCWIVLRHPTGRSVAIRPGTAAAILTVLVLSETGVVESLLGSSLSLTRQQVGRAIQGTLSDIFILLIMLASTNLLARARRATETAELQERRMRLIFDQSNDAILVIDLENDVILDANPSACRLLEYSLQELVGTEVAAIHPHDRAALEAFTKDVIRDGGGRTDDLNCRTKSGRNLPAEISASPLELNGRQCLLAIVRNVSQRREAERKLHESLERYKLLVEATRVIPWQLDLATWRFTYVGPHAVEVFGYPIEAWYEPDFWSGHLHPDDAEETQRACREATDREEDHELEYRMLTADGETRWVRDIVSVVADESGPTMLRGILIDQTEQKQAEQALRESESLRRSIMDNSPDYVAMVDLSGRILFINQTGPHLTDEQVIGHTIYDHAPPAFHETIRDCFERVVQTGESDQFETEYHAPDGDVAVFAFRVGPFMQKGEVVSLILNATNVTEQKQTEAELHESERRLELAVSGGDLGLWDWNITTGDVYFNQRWVEMLGYTLEEIKPHVSVWDELVHPDDRARVVEAMQQHLKGIEPIYVTEHRLKTKSGEWKWILDRGKVVERDADGRAIRASGTQTDIDERKQVSEALRHSEALRRSMNESSPDHIILCDADGTIQYINRTVPDLTVEQVIGTRIYDYFSEKFYENVSDCLAQVCETREPGSFEVDYYSSDGELMIFESRVGPVVEEGKVVALTIHGTDITARRLEEQKRLALETRMLSAQKFESLGVMAGGVAHDFNNLLTGILGQANLALTDLPKTSEVRGHVASIETAARRASELCRQLLVFAGRESFTTEVIRLNTVVTEMAELLKAVISKNAVLQVELADKSPSIDGDPAQIGRIVVNLITNASDAVIQESSPATITIRTGVTSLEEADIDDVLSDEEFIPGSYAYIEVADTGCGMDDETRKKVFDPFYSTKFTGRGLGLAAVLGIVRGHHGGIQISTEPGVGTTIRILLPLSGETPGVPLEGPSHPALTALSGTGTILVVDDEEIVRSVTQQALERAGYQVLVAEDGQTGVEVFEDHADEVSAVLLDVTMPKLDGRQALEAIRRIRIDVPVIMTSGYERLNGRKSGGLRPNNTDFLQKPYRPRTLIDKLNNILHE